MKLISSLICLLAATQVSANLATDYMQGRKVWERKTEIVRKSLVEEPVIEGTYDQTVNHFASKPTDATFKQRFFINANHYKPGGPLIFLPGGEGDLRKTDVLRGLPYDMTVKHNALLVTLEHRFYGESSPSTDPKDLWLLSVDQAIEDFHKFTSTYEFKAGTDTIKGGKWIAFGGSYSGNVAAWLRLKYPNTYWAAHASSAPVWAKEMFYEYDQAVEDAIPQIGGSKACAEGLIKTHKYLDSILLSGNKKKILDIKTKFGLANVTDDRDFASWVTTVLAASVQYGPTYDFIGKQQTISAYCDDTVISSATASPADRLDYLAKLVKQYDEEQEITVEYISTKTKAEIPRDSWMWQVCTEFGYLQIARQGSHHLYSSLIDANYFQHQCRVGFPKVIDGNTGRQVKHIRPDTDAINKKYLSTRITKAVSRVLFADGTVDPWARLGVYKQKSSRRNEIVTHFGHHCDEFSSRNVSLPWRTELGAVWDKWIANAPPALP
ncbi:peptidase S28 [Powellomyces hirtus]|nr:peptidase S28 [Powellomyces hirtus]